MNRYAFGSRMRQVRAEQNFTAEMLAEVCNVSPIFVRMIESGNRSPSLESFILFCNALQASPAYLLGTDLIPKKDDADLEKLINSIQALSPKQVEMVKSIVDVIIDQ